MEYLFPVVGILRKFKHYFVQKLYGFFKYKNENQLEITINRDSTRTGDWVLMLNTGNYILRITENDSNRPISRRRRRERNRRRRALRRRNGLNPQE